MVEQWLISMKLSGWILRSHEVTSGICRRKGNYERALAEYEQALRAKPDSAAALNSRAWLLLEMGKIKEARSDVERALALDPNYSNARDTRGHILLASQDY
jgi:tetratricopeptide (TPR) repeat protein